MTKREKVEGYLAEMGIKVLGKIQVIRGPERKSHIPECWTVEAIDNAGKKIEINSTYSFHQLHHGIELQLNDKRTCLYGDFIAVPL